MAVPSIISAEQYHDIFGSSEEENNNREEENNTADSDGSDIDVQEVESDLEEDESDSESDNDSNASDTIEWSDELEDFDIDEFSGRQEMKFNVPDNVSANDFFSQLFGDSIMDIIVTETNRYARQKLANTPRIEKWKDITKQELRAYFGICIIMGINNLPRIAMYWSTDPFIGNTGIQSVMARNRFEELSQYLHFTNSETEPPRGDANFDRLFKIRPILSIVLNNIQNAYEPSKNLSVWKGESESVCFAAKPAEERRKVTRWRHASSAVCAKLHFAEQCATICTTIKPSNSL